MNLVFTPEQYLTSFTSFLSPPTKHGSKSRVQGLELRGRTGAAEHCSSEEPEQIQRQFLQASAGAGPCEQGPCAFPAGGARRGFS